MAEHTLVCFRQVSALLNVTKTYKKWTKIIRLSPLTEDLNHEKIVILKKTKAPGKSKHSNADQDVQFNRPFDPPSEKRPAPIKTIASDPNR